MARTKINCFFSSQIQRRQIPGKFSPTTYFEMITLQAMDLVTSLWQYETFILVKEFYTVKSKKYSEILSVRLSVYREHPTTY